MNTAELRQQTLSKLRLVVSPDTAALSTADMARVLGLRPQTLRRGLSEAGHYLGIVPLKLPNGRLLWPCREVKP